MFVPLRLAADARNLELITKLDPRIDEVHSLLCCLSTSTKCAVGRSRGKLHTAHKVTMKNGSVSVLVLRTTKPAVSWLEMKCVFDKS
jgi:hypothetical protein